MNRISKLFQPSLIIPKNSQIKSTEITSKSHKVSLKMDYQLQKCIDYGFQLIADDGDGIDKTL